jgi:hypothetical protein
MKRNDGKHAPERHREKFGDGQNPKSKLGTASKAARRQCPIVSAKPQLPDMEMGKKQIPHLHSLRTKSQKEQTTGVITMIPILGRKEGTQRWFLTETRIEPTSCTPNSILQAPAVSCDFVESTRNEPLDQLCRVRMLE